MDKAIVDSALKVIDDDIRALESVREAVRSEAFACAVDLMLNCTGKILITGCGTSANVAERGAHLLSVCGCPSFFLSASDALHGGMGVLAKNDILLALSKGGNSKELVDFCRLAHPRCDKVIVCTQKPQSNLAREGDVVIHLPFSDDCDLGGVVATGSSSALGTLLDAFCETLRKLSGYTWEQLLYTHPAGDVGFNARNTLNRLGSQKA